jgi:hemoglobin-like flavoprotein
MSMMMWHKAFFQAMHEVHVEKLKKRIESAWGPAMDKSADAAIESFGKVWQSMLMKSEATNEFASKLQKVYSEASRK